MQFASEGASAKSQSIFKRLPPHLFSHAMEHRHAKR
jgi:hypothetical protein